MPDTTYNLGIGEYTCPNGVRKVQVLVWGGGGGGGGQNLASDGGGGGGGGAFAEDIDDVVPATVYDVQVGDGGLGIAGNTGSPLGGGLQGGSSLWRTTVVVAEGGKGGRQSTGTPPIGGVAGLASASTGRGKFNGGYGARGRNNNTGIGGYGGSSAGIGADGVSTSADTAWVQNFPGGNPILSGAGGNGGGANAAGSPGTAPGGGGGGSGEGLANIGGDGAAGRVVVRYIPPCLHLLGVC